MVLALEARGVGKEYQLGGGVLSGGTLYETLAGMAGRLLRGESGRVARERFWALRDVDFEVAPGEVMGVVGRNGAGKSTLLKILSRITAPTAGRILVRGNLASLLEVGTGFHPELSGRENIYLNGVILGMKKREIDRKFDEIVAFAEVEKFLETPVKRYSSGMYIRLAFAVAAHLDADVLLVDEVLAVGDLAFQRKSLGKMGEVARGGRTVVFVSHNLGAVRSLCDTVLLLEQGRVVFRGVTEEGLVRYESSLVEAVPNLAAARFTGPLGGRFRFDALEVTQGGEHVALLDPNRPVEIVVRGRASESFTELEIAIALFRDGVRLFTCHDAPAGAPLAAGAVRSTFELPASTLRPGRYTLGVGATARARREWCWSPEAAVLEVSEKWEGGTAQRDEGLLTIPATGRRERNGD